MAELPSNHRRAVRLLSQQGYTVGKGGRHGTKMIKQGKRPVILPHHGGRDYGKGLMHAIAKQAGLEGREDQRWSSRSPSTRTRGSSGQRSPSYRDASPPAER